MRLSILHPILGVLCCSAPLSAGDIAEQSPKAMPRTRPALKQTLEDLKQRKPRLPMPPDTEPGTVHNARMRSHYLPPSWNAGLAPQKNDGQAARGRTSFPPLDDILVTSCFWIVSRANNCHYCLGHQELKLAAQGLAEERIASLDSQWASFDPRSRLAFEYARKLTLQPYDSDRADIDALREQFEEQEILALTFAIARFNATNRWTDALGLPQDNSFRGATSVLLTPTMEPFLDAPSIILPAIPPNRSWPTAAEIQALSNRAYGRVPYLELLTPTGERTGNAERARPVSWESPLLKAAGPEYVAALQALFADENLPPKIKAEIAWITAVSNRASYALGVAQRRLELLQAGPPLMPPRDARYHPQQASADEVVYSLALRLTEVPHQINDADIASVRRHWGDAPTAQIVHAIAMANLFDRFTEALGLGFGQ
jgi:alkylhydroperoxidase family enzyme